MSAAWDKQQGLTDHTIDTKNGIFAGFMLKTSGAIVGYLWCTGNVWRWKSADGLAFGERQTKKAAVETLHDVRAQQTGQARSSRPPLPPPLATEYRTFHHSRPIIKAQPEPPPAPKRQVVWGDNDSDGADLTAAIGAALNKHKGGS